MHPISTTDKVFIEEKKIEDFKFGNNVVAVFDDMVTRSVPFYLEMQRMITEIVPQFALPNTTVYDLGCSTGTTLINLDKVLLPTIDFIGIDNSEEMLAKCNENFKNEKLQRKYKLEYTTITERIQIQNASAVILCLTLQFIRPFNREKIIQNIYNQMNENACLILIEKVIGEEALFNRQFIKFYYDFKRRNNYNELEIAQKREALENVLIPYKLSENIELLHKIGFNDVETFFKWYNFCGITAVKKNNT